MPGIASADTTIGPINPATLIGRADPSIVEPRNVALLGDAFSKGFITTDDIIKRVGTLGRTKDKAEIDMASAQSMQAQEQMSPEAQAARAAGLGANTSQQQLAQAEAERKKVLQQYPAVAYFDKFAPAAGITAPTTADGLPDYKQMEKIGSEMAVWQSQKTDAQAERDNIVTQESADGLYLMARTKQGLQVDPKKVDRLDRLIARPFQRKAAGDVFAGEAGSVITAAQQAAAPTVEPKAAVGAPLAPMIDVPGAPAAVPGVPGAVMSLGPPKVLPVKAEDSVKQAQALLTAQGLTPVIDGAIEAVKRGTAVGPMEGSRLMQIGNWVGAALGLGRETEFQDQDKLKQAISNKILEGAQVMKGNLSDKDVAFLKATVPQLTSTEATWNTYLNLWKAMNQINIDILSGKVARDPNKDLFAPKDFVDPDTSPALPMPKRANMPTVKSAAEAAALPSTVEFFLTPDDRPKKNPNFRRP